MISKARLRYLRSSPQKTRLVVDQIRGLGVNEALATLDDSHKAVAVDVAKLLRSAVANAQQGDQRADADTLYVSRAWVDCGPMMKRMRPATFGRAFRVVHRLCHVSLELDSRGETGPRLSRAKRRAQANREARKAASRGKPAAADAGTAGKKAATGDKKRATKAPAGKKKSAKKAAARKTAAKAPSGKAAKKKKTAKKSTRSSAKKSQE